MQIAQRQSQLFITSFIPRTKCGLPQSLFTPNNLGNLGETIRGMEKNWANISALSPQQLAKGAADDIAKSFSKLSLEPVFLSSLSLYRPCYNKPRQ
jgi:hypothetical protein